MRRLNRCAHQRPGNLERSRIGSREPYCRVTVVGVKETKWILAFFKELASCFQHHLARLVPEREIFEEKRTKIVAEVVPNRCLSCHDAARTSQKKNAGKRVIGCTSGPLRAVFAAIKKYKWPTGKKGGGALDGLCF